MSHDSINTYEEFKSRFIQSANRSAIGLPGSGGFEITLMQNGSIVENITSAPFRDSNGNWISGEERFEGIERSMGGRRAIEYILNKNEIQINQERLSVPQRESIGRVTHHEENSKKYIFKYEGGPLNGQYGEIKDHPGKTSSAKIQQGSLIVFSPIREDGFVQSFKVSGGPESKILHSDDENRWMTLRDTGETWSNGIPKFEIMECEFAPAIKISTASDLRNALMEEAQRSDLQESSLIKIDVLEGSYLKSRSLDFSEVEAGSPEDRVERAMEILGGDSLIDASLSDAFSGPSGGSFSPAPNLKKIGVLGEFMTTKLMRKDNQNRIDGLGQFRIRQHEIEIYKRDIPDSSIGKFGYLPLSASIGRDFEGYGSKNSEVIVASIHRLSPPQTSEEISMSIYSELPRINIQENTGNQTKNKRLEVKHILEGIFERKGFSSTKDTSKDGPEYSTYEFPGQDMSP